MSAPEVIEVSGGGGGGGSEVGFKVLMAGAVVGAVALTYKYIMVKRAPTDQQVIKDFGRLNHVAMQKYAKMLEKAYGFPISATLESYLETTDDVDPCAYFKKHEAKDDSFGAKLKADIAKLGKWASEARGWLLGAAGSLFGVNTGDDDSSKKKNNDPTTCTTEELIDSETMIMQENYLKRAAFERMYVDINASSKDNPFLQNRTDSAGNVMVGPYGKPTQEEMKKVQAEDYDSYAAAKKFRDIYGVVHDVSADFAKFMHDPADLVKMGWMKPEDAKEAIDKRWWAFKMIENEKFYKEHAQKSGVTDPYTDDSDDASNSKDNSTPQ